MNTRPRRRQELETDVVVAGYGGAGATAAIVAHDAGARVIILEKMPQGGGNTLASADSILAPTGMGAVRYFEALTVGATDHDVIETFVRDGLNIEEWIHQLGSGTEPHTPPTEVMFPGMGLPSWKNAPGGEFITRFFLTRGNEMGGPNLRTGKNPGSLWRFLDEHVRRRGITIMTSAPATELITTNGEVTAVRAETGDGETLIQARKAVVLACGGFEYNETMKDAFLPCPHLYCFGPPGNTGDGIIMAQKVGAALWHMTSLFGPLCLKAPEFDSAFGIRVPGERFIFVDGDARRFTDETALKIHDMWRAVALYDPERQRYPRIPTYCIFDEVTRKRAPLYRGTGANANYAWSSDNSREIARGWISQAQTIRELAMNIPLDVATLENTVNAYNQSCRLGADPRFGRPKELLGPIENPPFYSIKLWPGLMSTHGGPRRDKQARVLNHEGTPIPRLYSAGELGALSSVQYEAGTDLCECLVFGRIAGQNAAMENSW